MITFDLRRSLRGFLSKLRSPLPTVAADTIALLLYSVAGAALTIVCEIFFLKLSGKQWASIRVVYNILRFAGAWLCGTMTDQLRHRIQGDSKHPFRLAVAGATSLSLYQLPIYALSARLVGVELAQIQSALGFYFASNLFFGWAYVLILDWVRSRMAVSTEPP